MLRLRVVISIIFLFLLNPLYSHPFKLQENFSINLSNDRFNAKVYTVVSGPIAREIRSNIDKNKDNKVEKDEVNTFLDSIEKNYHNTIVYEINKKSYKISLIDLKLINTYNVTDEAHKEINDASLTIEAEYSLGAKFSKDNKNSINLYVKPVFLKEAKENNKNIFLSGYISFSKDYVNIVSNQGYIDENSVTGLIFTNAKSFLNLEFSVKKDMKINVKSGKYDSLVSNVIKSNKESDNRLLKFLEKNENSFFFYIFALATAFVLGAFHALSPGHGKTLVAAYLVGSKGTVRHAMILGLVVTFTHVFSVIIIGVLTLYLQKFYLKENIIPYIEMISAFIIVGIGIYLLSKRVRRMFLNDEHIHAHHSHDHEHHSHDHEHHSHDHEHHLHDHEHHSHDLKQPSQDLKQPLQDLKQPLQDLKQPLQDLKQPLQDLKQPLQEKNTHSHKHQIDDHTHSHDNDKITYFEKDGKMYHSHGGSYHSHEVPDEISLFNLISLGISGGIVPCPTAFVVLLAAISINKILFGLNMIFAFSFGLAFILILIGILVVKAMPMVNSFDEKNRFMRFMPIVSAFFVILIGFAMTYKAYLDF